MITPPRWNRQELDAERARSIEVFRKERLEEPVEAYSAALDEYQGHVEDLLEATVDLSHLDHDALAELLADKATLHSFRYLSGPPISADDLKTLAEAVSLSPSRLRSDPELIGRIARIVIDCLDRRRFPWVCEGREPSEHERSAAVLASAALMAYQRIQTDRRSSGKIKQEGLVADALQHAGFRNVPTRKVSVLAHAPNAGEFCRESHVGTRKADFIVGLWDERKLLVECKVSNSELNSVKRLNNDAAAKAEAWLNDFGPRNVVPMAILSGVFKLANLLEPQERGLALFWAHQLEAFVTWCNAGRPQ